jgi:hypothetical protein
MQDLEMTGHVMLSQEIDAARASEGRWPRICERARTTAEPAVVTDGSAGEVRP